ncbi:MAG: SCO family protein [Bdellovibrionaceae bacterium]|nr:SCO family protein [Pseudobdellovibrionaceae bacterium]
MFTQKTVIMDFKKDGRHFQFGLFAILWVLCAFPLFAQAYDTKNPTEVDVARERKKLENVGLNPDKLGSQIDLNLEFADEHGNTAPLKDYFNGDLPVLLSLVYYRCPNLCNFHMNGVVAALDKVKLQPNTEYRWLTVSMDTEETPEQALDKKKLYLEQESKEASTKREQLENGWKFLTGSEANVKALTEQLGFAYRWDPESKQFAHEAAIYTVTSDGTIAQILPGIEFIPQTIQLTLVDAAKGKIGTFVDKMSLMCFQFDPKRNKYTVYAYNFMRAGAVFTVLLLLIFLGPNLYQSLKRKS